MPPQADCRGSRYRGKRNCRGDGSRIEALQLLEREHGRCNKACKQTKAKDIECPAAIAPGARLQTQHKHHGGETDRKVDEKNRLPAQVLCEVAPGKWTEGAGADRDSRPPPP